MSEFLAKVLDHLELINLLGLGVQHVHSTTQSRVEGTDNPYHIKRIFDVWHGCSDQRLFDGPWNSLIVPGTSIPDGRCHDLVVLNFSVFDRNPVAQGTPRRLGQSHPLGLLGNVESILEKSGLK
jgi:hypothetical protein